MQHGEYPSIHPPHPAHTSPSTRLTASVFVFAEILMYSIVQVSMLPSNPAHTLVPACNSPFVNLHLHSQKEGLGLDKAVEEVKHRMSRYQVTVCAMPSNAVEYEKSNAPCTLLTSFVACARSRTC